MNDSTQDPQGQGGPGPHPDAAAAASTTVQTGGPAGDEAAPPGAAGAGEWTDSATDPGSGVPGGGRHKYASGKTYCGTEN
jgi:hypothetical protein